jgi:hypothetical protein
MSEKSAAGIGRFYEQTIGSTVHRLYSGTTAGRDDEDGDGGGSITSDKQAVAGFPLLALASVYAGERDYIWQKATISQNKKETKLQHGKC